MPIVAVEGTGDWAAGDRCHTELSSVFPVAVFQRCPNIMALLLTGVATADTHSALPLGAILRPPLHRRADKGLTATQATESRWLSTTLRV